MRSFMNYSLGMSVLAFMAADAAASGVAEEPVDDAATGTSLAGFSAQLPTMRQFDPKNPAVFGNALLTSLIKAGNFDEELAAAQQAGEEVKKYIGFELTKAVMAAAEEQPKNINLYHIFEGKTQVEKLFSRLLQYFGVIKREIVDEDVATIWTDKEMSKSYDYSSIDKEKDEGEYNKRFNNRKRLNMRLTDACKSAIALVDHGVKSPQLKLVQNATTKATEPVIENAPDFLRGDNQKNGSTVVFGKRNPNEGAKIAPTLAALVRAATEQHADKSEKTGIEGERADKGNDRSGDAKLGMSDEDFGGVVNNLRRAVAAQEGQLTEEMIKQLAHLVPFIDEQITITRRAIKAAAEAAKNEDQDDDDEDEDGLVTDEDDVGTGITDMSEDEAADEPVTKKPGKK